MNVEAIIIYVYRTHVRLKFSSQIKIFMHYLMFRFYRVQTACYDFLRTGDEFFLADFLLSNRSSYILMYTFEYMFWRIFRDFLDHSDCY